MTDGVDKALVEAIVKAMRAELVYSVLGVLGISAFIIALAALIFYAWPYLVYL